MKLRKFLKYLDGVGATVVLYVGEEEEPAWIGTLSNIPWWLAELKLQKPHTLDCDEPFSFRQSLGEKYNNKPGFVICLE